MSLLVMVPTRGRPQNMLDLIATFLETSELDSTRLWFWVDNDDPERHNYKSAVEPFLGLGIEFTCGPRLRLGPTLNKMAAGRVGQFEYLGFVGDDHRFRTPGWDVIFEEALSWHSMAMVYGNDLVHGPNIPTAAFMTSTIPKKLGYFVPPGIMHLFADNAWKTMGEATQLIYRGDVIIEHMHPLVGKAESDEGYVEVNAPEVYQRDQAAFELWRDYSGWQNKLR